MKIELSLPLYALSGSFDSVRAFFKTHRVAIQAFAELAISIGINVGIAIFFGATPPGFIILNVLAAAWAVGTFAARFFLKDQYFKSGSFLARFSFINTFLQAGISPILHESGHAAFSILCFKHANPKIAVRPFQGGMTIYAATKILTKLGSLLGLDNVKIFIAAGGIVFSSLVGISLFTIGNLLRESHPKISLVCIAFATSQIFNEIVYGFTAFLSPKTLMSHDFIHLWSKGGIHPLIPIACLAVIPIAQGCFELYKHLQQC